MRAALLAFVISILSIMPAQAITFAELFVNNPGGKVLNRITCVTTESQDINTCVVFVMPDGNKYMSVVEGNTPAGEVLKLFKHDGPAGPANEINIENFNKQGSVFPETEDITG